MQIITIAGKLGRDAELRNTQNGDSVCSFSVAVDQRNGREKTTNWWRVSLWGKRGEALAQYLTKGASVSVSGSFELGEYEGKPQLNIRASEIALQGGKSDSQPAQQAQGSTGNGGPRNGFATDLDDDLIPF
jgi:single-strand DNA-binding protein